MSVFSTEPAEDAHLGRVAHGGVAILNFLQQLAVVVEKPAVRLRAERWPSAPRRRDASFRPRKAPSAASPMLAAGLRKGTKLFGEALHGQFRLCRDCGSTLQVARGTPARCRCLFRNSQSRNAGNVRERALWQARARYRGRPWCNRRERPKPSWVHRWRPRAGRFPPRQGPGRPSSSSQLLSSRCLHRWDNPRPSRLRQE